MQSVILTKSEARKIILKAAGLAKSAQFGFGIEAVHRLINHLGFVQLDTNYVVERAHHHVMFVRIPDYETIWLSELVEDGRIFEYFTSDAGYLPMEDFQFSLAVKEAFQLHEKPLSRQELNSMQQIMDQVERDGPVRVGDFENDRVEASTGWWDWRPAKIALERLYLEGKLMITRDSKFHKTYDIPLNLVPMETVQVVPTPEAFARFMIRRTLGALGISSIKEMAWRSRRVKGNLIKEELKEMMQEGEVIAVAVQGVKTPQFMLAGQQTSFKLSDEVFILSPFDILNVFRHRLRDFFDFDYQIECFVPAPKRLYGYFSLPVLAGEIFIARMDAKADRKNKVLLVHNIHFEEIEINEVVLEKFIISLKAFVRFNQCKDIMLSKSNKQIYLEKIRKGFSL